MEILKPEIETRTAIHRATALFRVIAAFSLFGAVAIFEPAKAVGQIAAESEFVSLVSVGAAELDRGETVVLLTFAPRAPSFEVAGSGSLLPEISLSRSTRNSNARFALSGSGFVRRVGFVQDGARLKLSFSSVLPAELLATQVGDRTISISIKAAANPLAVRPAVRNASDSVSRTGLGYGADAFDGAGPISGLGLSPGPGASQDPGASAQRLPQRPVRQPGQDEFVVVMLKYADVSEVVGLLTDGLTVRPSAPFVPRPPISTQPSVGVGFSQFNPSGMPLVSDGSGGGDPGPSVEPNGVSVDEVIGIDRRLNAITLRGSPEQVARLRAEIAKIDVPVKNVLLETMFVELDRTAARNIGLDFGNSNAQVAVATVQSGQFNAADPSSRRPITSVALQAAIYAQVNSGHGRIISRPSITSQSGGAAKIVTGDALPIQTSIALAGVNGVAQQVQYVSVGVTLQVAPRVTGDGFVTTQVYAVVSSVTGSFQGLPIVRQREATTSATVRDGQSFIIGGLSQEEEQLNNSSIPGLSSLPVIGNIFSRHGSTKASTELYIVITPKISQDKQT